MFLYQPVDVEEDVKWTLKPRKVKRKCEYLNDNREEPFGLQDDGINENNKLIIRLNSEMTSTNLNCKKICIPNQPTIKSHLIGFKHKITSFIWKIDPSLVIFYLHAFLNLFLISVFILLVSYLLLCTAKDISYKISVKKLETKFLMEEAKKLYFLNKCDPTTRVPAMENQCNQWDHLTRHGFNGIKYTKIIFEMLADVLDGFVSKFKLKSLAVIVTFMGVYLVLNRNRKA
jgi:hypothetical protein